MDSISIRKKGFALEYLYHQSTGMDKNTIPWAGTRIPDFVLNGYYFARLLRGTSISIFYEAKAVKTLQFSQQIREEIDGARNAHVFGVPGLRTAGELGIAEFVLVSFKEHFKSGEFDRIKAHCVEQNVVLKMTDYPHDYV